MSQRLFNACMQISRSSVIRYGVPKIKAPILMTRPQFTHFHTSSPRQALPPIVMIILRPIIQVGVALFGRRLRRWWQRLPLEERIKIKARISSKRTHIAAASTVLGGGGYLYYLDHIEEDPITKRKRFLIYTEEQMNQFAKLQLQEELAEYEEDLVPATHPIYQRVVSIGNRLLHANQEYNAIKNKEWSVTVIDKPDLANAFVLPNGSIIVFSGMLHMCTNDDQLAVVMAHEMAHSLLSHSAETLSNIFYLEALFLIPIVALWTLLPDAGALVIGYISKKIVEILFELPYSRFMENEADRVGMLLAAKACFDIREAPVFWGKMSQMLKSNVNEQIEWISTHPTSENRQIDLGLLIPEAMKARDAAQCPLLPPSTANQLLYGTTKSRSSA